MMINVLDSYKLSDLFYKNSLVNIYKNNINLLIFRSLEASTTFLETLNILGNCKIGSIMMHSKNYIINANEIKSENNILFSMLVLLKVLNNQESLLKVN